MNARSSFGAACCRDLAGGRSRVRGLVIVSGLLFLTIVGASSAFAVTASPLPQRVGVVVGWQAASSSAVLVTPAGRVYVVHGVPKVTPGQRVLMHGIRWGTPGQGVVWGPRRSAWGIKKARNGTFETAVTLLGRARKATLRAQIVRRIGTRGVVVSVPGATIALPLAHGATWVRPSGTPAGRFGSASEFRLAIDARGRVSVTSARQSTPAAKGAVIPFAGRVTASDRSKRTIVVTGGSSSLPVTFTIEVPSGFDYRRYRPGRAVSGLARTPSGNASGLLLVSIWLNGSFRDADSPGTTGPGTNPSPTKPKPPATPTSPTGSSAPAGWPSAATTGVPAGVALTAYAGPCTITAAGTTIDAKTINCSLAIKASGVTITRSKITGTVATDEASTTASFTISDSDVNAGNEVATGIGAVNFTATRVHVVGGNRSINCFRNCTVQDSYVHGQFRDNTGQAHESGVRVGSQSTIRHNTLVCDAPDVPPDAGCSASLTGYGDFATVEYVTVDGNYFPPSTGGFCAYGGSSPGKPYSAGANHIVFTNNVFVKGSRFCGYYGPITHFDSSRPGNVWTNNRWADGAVVPPAF